MCAAEPKYRRNAYLQGSRPSSPCGQAQPKRRSLRESALDGDRAVVGFGDRLWDRQPEAGTRYRVGCRARSAKETSEQSRQLVGRNADPRVADAEGDRASVLGGSDLDPPAFRGELDCVGDEVVDQLRDPDAITERRFQPARLERQLDLLGVRGRLCSLGRLGQQLVDVRLSERQL
jgi:hypothetical protein